MQKNQIFEVMDTQKNGITSIVGSAGSGKTQILIDYVVNYIRQYYGENVDNNKAMELSYLLFDQLGILFLTGDLGFSVLHQISKKLFPKEDYDFQPIAVTYNMCKVISKSLPLKEAFKIATEQRSKIIILDDYLFTEQLEAQNSAALASGARAMQNILTQFNTFCMKNNCTLINITNTNKNPMGSGSSYPTQVGFTSSLILEVIRKETAPYQCRVVVKKNRFGTPGQVFDYEINPVK